MRSGRELTRSIGSVASGLPASKWVPAVEARWPPAENPMIAIRFGSKPQLSTRADRPDRAAGVLEHRRMVIARAEPVLENERRDPQRVEPFGDLLALVVVGEHPRIHPPDKPRRPRRWPSRIEAAKSLVKETSLTGSAPFAPAAHRSARAEPSGADRPFAGLGPGREPTRLLPHPATPR